MDGTDRQVEELVNGLEREAGKKYGIKKEYFPERSGKTIGRGAPAVNEGAIARSNCQI